MASATSLLAPAKAYDPTLASLFASSAGPVKAPKQIVRTTSSRLEDFNEAEAHDSEPEELSQSSSVHTDSGSLSADPPDQDVAATDRPRKRRRIDPDDLEASYFRRLAADEERESRGERRLKIPTTEDDTSSEGSTTSEAVSDDNDRPAHESLAHGQAAADKSKRTIFISNVSTAAIKSKSSRKVLLDHLESVIGKTSDSEASKIESIRFRSTAYAAGVGPKRAAYAKKELKEQTAHSTNAYVVFYSEADANTVAKRLNATVILDRHIRIDNLASPGIIDHKRCVFVGNLPFVDEETTEDKDENGEGKRKRPKAKQPADAEEGLWRAFSKAGKVENVRVVRDKETRVGKGFAYVQFADVNGVEAALLLDGKKFPPMLPRTLRVSRARRTRPKPAVDSGHGNWDGKKGASLRRGSKLREGGTGKSSRFVFEGHRATSQSRRDVKVKARGTKPVNRSARRGASFKSSGGKKKRDKQ